MEDDTATGRMLAKIMAAMAEHESASIEERRKAIRAMGSKINHDSAKRALTETVETLAREGIDGFSVPDESVFDDGKQITFIAYDNVTGDRVMMVLRARVVNPPGMGGE